MMQQGVERVFQTAKAVVCDFDGTLVDSNPIKLGAFERCFDEQIGPTRETILAYCRSHHHTPRHEKFRSIYEQILEQPYTAALEADLLSRYEAHTTEQIIAAPELPGASAWLAQVRQTHPVALLSSTPHDILMGILDRRGWRGWFTAIQGAPIDKACWLVHWSARQHVTPSELVFLGDTAEDARSATQAGCVFIAVGPQAAAIGAAYAIADFTELTATAYRS